MIKTMKKQLTLFMIILGFIAINHATQAQSALTIDASQAYTNFKFLDSEGNRDESYSGNYTGGYNIGYRYNSEGGLLIRAAIGMRKAGASLVYEDANYSWNLQYGEVKIGAGYVHKIGRVNPYLTISPYFAYLLKATQTLNHEDYDILNSNSLQRIDYGVFASPGVQLRLSDAVSAYAEFNYMMGLKNIETGSKGGEVSSEQKAYNMSYSITGGLAFTIN